MKKEFAWNSRKAVFLFRIWITNLFYRFFFRLGVDFNPLIPGLEVKYACEEAEKVGADLQFLGPELNDVTWNRLYHETRLNFPQYLWNRWLYRDTQWTKEIYINRRKISLVGPAAFTEKCLDQYLMNWYIKATEYFFPPLKNIFVDLRDKDLFTQID